MKLNKILNFILLLPILCACNKNAIYERAYNYLMKIKGQMVETSYTDTMGNKRKGRILNLKKLPKKCAFEIENGHIARTLNINSNRIQKNYIAINKASNFVYTYVLIDGQKIREGFYSIADKVIKCVSLSFDEDGQEASIYEVDCESVDDGFGLSLSYTGVGSELLGGNYFFRNFFTDEDVTQDEFYESCINENYEFSITGRRLKVLKEHKVSVDEEGYVGPFKETGDADDSKVIYQTEYKNYICSSNSSYLEYKTQKYVMHSFKKAKYSEDGIDKMQSMLK